MTRRRKRTSPQTPGPHYSIHGKSALSISDLLAHGNIKEVREALGHLGLLLRFGEPLPPPLASWLGEALEAIGNGKNANIALGLNTKRRHSLTETIAKLDMVNSARNTNKAEAVELVARYDAAAIEKQIAAGKSPCLLDDKAGVAAERFKKRIQRLPKHLRQGTK